MRITAGSVQASRNARTPLVSASHASALPAVCATIEREHLVGELRVDGAEEVALVGEVVVERAAGDVRAAHDLLGPDVRVPARGEQLARDAQQLGPRGDSLLLPWHTACMLGHTICM